MNLLFLIWDIVWDDKWHGVPVPVTGLAASFGSYLISLNIQGVAQSIVLLTGAIVGVIAVAHGVQNFFIKKEKLKQAKMITQRLIENEELIPDNITIEHEKSKSEDNKKDRDNEKSS